MPRNKIEMKYSKMLTMGGYGDNCYLLDTFLDHPQS